MNTKKTINEAQLRKIIAESVKRVLNEGQEGLLTVGELKSILSGYYDEDFIAFVPEDSQSTYRVLANISINEFRWNGYDDRHDDDGRTSVNLIMRRG